MRVRVTHQLQYALYGLFDLAYHAPDCPTPLQVIGQRQCIPGRYLEQIFQRLRRAGLVESKRGPGGGYVLARAANEISVADVIRAVEGQLLELPESEGEQPENPARPKFVWDRLETSLEQVLGQRSLADLCNEAARADMRRADSGAPTYEI